MNCSPSSFLCWFVWGTTSCGDLGCTATSGMEGIASWCEGHIALGPPAQEPPSPNANDHGDLTTPTAAKTTDP